MKIDLEELTAHDMSDDCTTCRTQGIVDMVLTPAAAAWEHQNQLPRFALALHGAAGLLSAMLEEGVPRDEIDAALGGLLDEIEQQIAENNMMGGPTQGNA